MTGQPRLTVIAAFAVVLTSLSLHPALDGLSWLLPVVLCVAAVALTGYVARRCRVPQLLVPLVEIGVLTVVLVQRFAHAEKILGVVPGHDVVAEARVLWDGGIRTIATFGPPVPVTPGLVLVLCGSLGLVAVVVDTIAVTYRSPAPAGLPLLVLYAVPAAVVPHGVPWVFFGVAAAGWLGLLLADGQERLGGWGRRPGSHTTADEASAGRRIVGRRIGLASVVLAILVPAVLPGLSAADFGHGLGAGTDGGTVDTVNPFVSLGSVLSNPDDSEVLTYTSDDPNPDYLHLVTLDTFDGVTWVPTNLETSGHLADGGSIPLPGGLASTPSARAVTTTVQLVGLRRSTWLPVPYPVTTVHVAGDSGRWLWDATNRVIWSADTRVDQVHYAATSVKVQPSAEQLEAAPPPDPVIAGALTDYPASVATTVIDQAHAIVARAKSPYAKAVALEKFFRDPANHFTYDTHVPQSSSSDPLVGFLETRVGFCQQYAGTFAVMARIVGLPTRVVVGFVAGDKIQGTTNTWSVTWHDLHAWPEVYFEGVGWLRFEPTPSTNVGVRVPDYAKPGRAGPVPPRVSPSPTTEPSASPAPSDRSPHDRALSPAAASSWSAPPAWLLAPVLLAATVLLPWAARLRQRRRRYARARRGDPREAAAAVWEELVATSVDLDLAWPASRTPRQVATSLIESARLERAGGSVGPQAADALRRLSVATERARYARTTDATPELVADIVCARAGLTASRGRFTRLRATFAPRSLLQQVSDRAADTFGWIELNVHDPLAAVPRWRGGRDLTRRAHPHQPRRSHRRRSRRGRPAEDRTPTGSVDRD